MHLLYVSNTYPSENGWGGIGTYTYHIARGMRNLGHEVTVLCQALKEPRDYHDDAGIRIISRPIWGSSETLSLVRRALEEIIATVKPDMIEAAEYGADVLEFQRAHPDFPVVVRFHLGSQMCALGNAPRWKRAVRRVLPEKSVKAADQLERESAQRAQGVTACSTWMLELYRTQGWRFPAHAQVIANPICDRDVDLSKKDYATPRVATVGRLDFRKGAPLFPTIIRDVLKEVPDTHFIIAGQDTERGPRDTWGSWIVAQIPITQREQVEMAGGVPYPQVPTLLETCNVAFFASEYESFGYTHVEAMQGGLACVLASPGGSRELGKHGESVLQVERRPAAIAAAIVSLLKSADNKRRLGENAAACVKATWINSIIGLQAIAFYQRVIESGRKQPECSITLG